MTDTTDDRPVVREDVRAVRRLTLNRPERLNALNHELLEALDAELAAAAADEGVRVLVLGGAGRAFCAGYDLDEDAREGTKDEAAWREEIATDTERILRIVHHPKPIIASVHSYCLAGGLDLMLACDLAVASDDARFGYVDVRFGSGVVSMLLPWVVGVRAAKELVLTGRDRVAPDEALRIGLVDRVVPRDELDATTLAIAEEIAMNEPVVVQAMKASINRMWEVAGIRRALDANAELDAAVEAANLPARDEFRRITQEQGLKAAIAWRDARYRSADR